MPSVALTEMLQNKSHHCWSIINSWNKIHNAELSSKVFNTNKNLELWCAAMFSCTTFAYLDIEIPQYSSQKSLSPLRVD